LKTALKDEAALVINSFQLTDANYDEAWAISKLATTTNTR
jgi:hypothetical protein